MILKNSISSDPYIFWLFDWDISRVFTALRWEPIYVCCQIDQEHIFIDVSPTSIVLTYADIVSCEKDVFSQARSGSTLNVKLTLDEEKLINRGRRSRNILYLVAANPLEAKLSIPESEEMISVINSYKENQVPSSLKNPYEREFRRRSKIQEFDATKWLANISPLEYVSVPHKWKSIGILFFAVLIGTPLSIAFIVLILKLLGLEK